MDKQRQDAIAIQHAKTMGIVAPITMNTAGPRRDS